MNATIRKIGNSEGVIIPKEILDRLGLKAGDNVEVREVSGQLVSKPLDDDFTRQLEHAETFTNTRRHSRSWPGDVHTLLSRQLIERLHCRQIERFGGAYGLRDEGILESALMRPVNKAACGATDVI
jgi:putative addiction module antidote